MARRHSVVVMGLTLAACGGPKPPPGNPPPPDLVQEPEPIPEVPEVHENPPPPEPIEPIEPVDIPRNPPTPLPAWDDVKSGHPEGATNPPRPVLIVTPEGACFKQWVSPMMRPTPGQPFGDRVEDCTADCGTAVQCPPKAAELLAAHEAKESDE